MHPKVLQSSSTYWHLVMNQHALIVSSCPSNFQNLKEWFLEISLSNHQCWKWTSVDKAIIVAECQSRISEKAWRLITTQKEKGKIMGLSSTYSMWRGISLLITRSGLNFRQYKDSHIKGIWLQPIVQSWVEFAITLALLVGLPNPSLCLIMRHELVH